MSEKRCEWWKFDRSIFRHFHLISSTFPATMFFTFCQLRSTFHTSRAAPSTRAVPNNSYWLTLIITSLSEHQAIRFSLKVLGWFQSKDFSFHALQNSLSNARDFSALSRGGKSKENFVCSKAACWCECEIRDSLYNRERSLSSELVIHAKYRASALGPSTWLGKQRVLIIIHEWTSSSLRLVTVADWCYFHSLIPLIMFYFRVPDVTLSLFCVADTSR